MSRHLKVVQEPETRLPLENCCICYMPTSFWYERKDVALCQSCARKTRANDVPTKRQWCEAVRARAVARAAAILSAKTSLQRASSDTGKQKK